MFVSKNLQKNHVKEDVKNAKCHLHFSQLIAIFLIHKQLILDRNLTEQNLL